MKGVSTELQKKSIRKANFKAIKEDSKKWIPLIKKNRESKAIDLQKEHNIQLAAV